MRDRPPTTVALSRHEFAREPQALECEWLVTNALGGFASGTVAQANTRRYHGLLVAALRPPVERVLLVSKVDASVQYAGTRFELGCNEFRDGTLAPRGYQLLQGFELQDGIPTWTYALSDALLVQRIWMENGQNTSYVSYTLERGRRPVQLELIPLCTYRDYHAHGGEDRSLDVSAEKSGCRITASPGARSYTLRLNRGAFSRAPDWYWGFHHRIEAQRGLDAREDLFRPGVFEATVAPDETVTLYVTAEPDADHVRALDVRTALHRERRRRRALREGVAQGAPEWVKQLTIAADAFLVARVHRGDAAARGTTIIAGYPWFGDWGRDTMIALPGLTLPTARASEAASILRTFAAHVSQGMLPNRLAEVGEGAEYNTADATLWYFHAIACYLETTGDSPLLAELYPVLQDIIRWHVEGTRYGIGVDPQDGLLRVGEPGVQLTWMDAKIGDRVVTPRTGKPVEINALWHYALVRMARWAPERGDSEGEVTYARSAARVRDSFARAFWYPTGGYLYDVIDAPDGEADASGRLLDRSLRPNQIFAIALGTDLLSEDQARSVVNVVARELLTPLGLRSLAPADQRYAPQYTGGPPDRDAVYHQGTVWSWLLGPFVLAHYRVYRDRAYAERLLSGLAAHLREACLGTISEIFDAAPPHRARGCCAQAWGVAETLRAWSALHAGVPS